MKKYDYIAFDLDGTLSDPEHGLIEGFIYAFKKMGVADYGDRESLRRFIGPSLYVVWQEEFGFNSETVIEAIEKFREYYNIYGWWDNKVYGGVREMLATLKARGKKLILATSKPEDTAKKIMSLFELDKYFDFIGGAAGDNRDHKWEVLSYSMRESGAVADNTVLVGDRMYDAEGAAKCGVDSLGVLWGHGSEEELKNAGFTYLAATPEELLELLK
ncbi:MAG: HAD hydrolase-like protein [Clostridia bacterium]|nr:HAD hydrolase-like protein [Clostridia bacterium]